MNGNGRPCLPAEIKTKTKTKTTNPNNSNLEKKKNKNQTQRMTKQLMFLQPAPWQQQTTEL